MNKRALTEAKAIGAFLRFYQVPCDPEHILPYSFISFDCLNGGLFSDGQRVVTGMPFTHSALTLKLLNMNVVWGADLTVDLQPWSNLSGEDYIAFTPVNGVFTQEQLDQAFENAFKKYAGQVYGVFEIPFFMWRGFCERVFGVDARKWHNFFPGRVICSQLMWYVMWELAQFRPEIMPILNQYRPASYNSGDHHRMMMDLYNKNLFRITNARWSF